MIGAFTLAGSIDPSRSTVAAPVTAARCAGGADVVESCAWTADVHSSAVAISIEARTNGRDTGRVGISRLERRGRTRWQLKYSTQSVQMLGGASIMRAPANYLPSGIYNKSLKFYTLDSINTTSDRFDQGAG